MKKILTTIILGSIGLVSFSQGPNYPGNKGQQQYPNYPQQNNNYNQYSSLLINGTQQRQLTVLVDNYQYQGNGNNGDINVGQLNAGNHTVVIYEWKRNFWGKNVQQVVYNSSLYLKPGFETTVYIDVFGRVDISERQLYNNGNYNQGGYGNNGNGVGYGYGRNKNKHKKQQCGNDGNRRDRYDD
jgi:hypothetical protein